MKNSAAKPNLPPSPTLHPQHWPAHAGHSHGDHTGHESTQAGQSHTDQASARPALTSGPSISSVLAWPAWQRVLAVSPVLLLLWLAVIWASAEVAPW